MYDYGTPPGIFRSLVLACILLAGILLDCPLPRGSTPAHAESGSLATAAIIRQRLEQAQLHGQRNVCRDQLHCQALLFEAYSSNGFMPLWTGVEQLRHLLGIIAGVRQEGLVPRDYHYQTLVEVFGQLQRRPDPVAAADLDILLTDALLRLGHDRYYGKVDPVALNGFWNLREGKNHLYAQQLLLALKENTLEQTLLDLLPDNPAYPALKFALLQYQAIADRGGWPRVEPGPTIREGDLGPRVDQLRRRLAVTGDLTGPVTESQAFDAALSEAVRRFQYRHYLDMDGIVGPMTLAAMNVSPQERVDQIRVNLERARWVLHDLPDSFAVVDIAGYLLSYYHEGALAWVSKVMVGQPFHQTPVFRSEIKYMVLNPTWTVPPSIAKNETVPKIISNPNYLQQEHLRIFDSNNKEIAPSGIDFSQYRGKWFPYTLRQDPGEHNALGRIKFIFPNEHSVYLHDTPSKTLFDKASRAFSHGCIRVQYPLDLGRLLLKNDTGNRYDQADFERFLAQEKPAHIPLAAPLPILLMYWTVQVENGTVRFKPDIYERDRPVLLALDRNLNGPPANSASPGTLQ